MDGIKEFFVILIAVAAAALFLRMLIQSVISVLGRKNEKQASAQVRVLSKSKSVGQSAVSEDGIRKGKAVYTVTFSLDGGTEFYVTEREFGEIPENSTGTLYYRGRTFLSFAADALSEGTSDEKIN